LISAVLYEGSLKTKLTPISFLSTDDHEHTCMKKEN